MKIMTFLKNWTLPIAMILGVVCYFAYVSIPVFDKTHAFVGKAISIVQPLLIFCMLFISFCRVSFKELKPHKWFAKLLLIQVLTFCVCGAIVAVFPDMRWRVIVESFMICMICPTATAAAVVTTKLRGNFNAVISYTCIINVAAAIVIPSVVPFLYSDKSGGFAAFETSFLLIMGKIFPTLILPLVMSFGVRHFLPKLHSALVKQTNLSFYMWAVALALAIGVTVKAIVHSDESLFNLVGIAVASLLSCAIQFALGRVIGKHHDDAIAGAQSLGQKNTVFAIWLGYTFMNPVTAMAGGFYSIWHNTVNSYQLWLERKKEKET